MYCSSDQYAGDGVNYVGSSSKNGNLIIGDNWQFRGKEIVLSIVQYLFGFNNGLKYAQEILWSGCSAGGQGVVNTVDEVSHVLLQVFSFFFFLLHVVFCVCLSIFCLSPFFF